MASGGAGTALLVLLLRDGVYRAMQRSVLDFLDSLHATPACWFEETTVDTDGGR